MDSVFQSYIELLPKNPILKKYGKVKGIFIVENNSEQILNPIFYGEFREEFTSLWSEYKLEKSQIQRFVSRFEIKANKLFHKPENGCMFYGRLGGNYLSIEYNLKDEIVNYCQFGIDISIRETKEFVALILNLAKKIDCILVGSNFKTFEPKVKEIDKYLRTTPAYKIIKEEKQFTERVKNGLEKTDVPFMFLDNESKD